MSSGQHASPTGGSLLPGTKVEVRNAYDDTWNRGFVVDAVTDTGYRLRRNSDDSVLPGQMAFDHVRRERRNSMWWM